MGTCARLRLLVQASLQAPAPQESTTAVARSASGVEIADDVAGRLELAVLPRRGLCLMAEDP